MSAAAVVAGIVDGLIGAGLVALERRQDAIDVVVARMRPSPPDIASGYFRDRDAVLSDADEVLVRDTEPPAGESSR